MRIRFVDVLLIGALIIVTAAIVWTMLNLGTTPITRPANPPTVADGNSPASPSSRIQPLAPGDAVSRPIDASETARTTVVLEAEAATAPGVASSAAQPEASAPVAPSGLDVAPAEASTDGSTVASAGSSSGSPPDPTIPAGQAAAVPETGPVSLGRIGYSFVTGGAGACGIVLEPWTHVAVSRELLAAYGCGATVTLTLDDEVAGRTQATVVVADTMNEAWSRTVNVYVGQDEPALSYGLTTGSLIPQ